MTVLSLKAPAIRPAAVPQQIGSDAGEWDGEIVKILNLGVRQRDAVKDHNDFLAGIESFGELQSFSETELQVIGVFRGILLAAKRKILVGSFYLAVLGSSCLPPCVVASRHPEHGT